jgi:predicted DNA-binding transcriptional regulator AlpA
MRGEICFVCGAETERERRLLDVGTAARMCRVSRPTIYRWMRARQIEWVTLPT